MPLDWPASGAIDLVSAARGEEAFAHSGIELTILAAVGLLMVSLLRRGLALLHVLWPETLAALALLGVALAGWTPLAAGMLALAIGLRVVWLVAAIQRVFPSWFTAAPKATNDDHGPIPSPPHTA